MLTIKYGNIVSDDFTKQADAIVNPTNPRMRYGMGVSGAIFEKAGIDELESYCESKFNVGYNENSNNMKPTEVRVTPGFNLGCDIIHAQGPNEIYFDIPEDELNPLLIKTYESIFEAIKERQYKRVIFPSLGTGHYGFSHEDIAPTVVNMLNDFSIRESIDIILVLFDEDTANLYKSFL